MISPSGSYSAIARGTSLDKRSSSKSSWAWASWTTMTRSTINSVMRIHISCHSCHSQRIGAIPTFLLFLLHILQQHQSPIRMQRGRLPVIPPLSRGGILPSMIIFPESNFHLGFLYALYMIPTLKLGRPRHLHWVRWPKKSLKDWYHDWSVNLNSSSIHVVSGLDRCLSSIHCGGTPSG